MAVQIDDLTLGRLHAATQGSDLTVRRVSVEEAIAQAKAASGPVIGLFEWREEHEAEQKRFCDALRRATPQGRCHILAIGGSSDPTLSRALNGAADDVLSRPFGGEVLLRLWQGLDSMEAAQASQSPHDTLSEALKSACSGDVAVRSGNVVGHIHVQNGFIVWANLSSVPASISEVLRHADITLNTQTLAAVKEECRTTQAHFMDVLIAWKLVDPAHAREAVRAFVDARVRLVLELPDATAIFLPKVRKHTEHLRFGAGELASTQSAKTSASLPPTSPSQDSTIRPLPYADITHLFQRATEIEGVLSVAVLDRKTGEGLLQSGAAIDAGIAWSQLGTLAALGSSADEVIGAVGDRGFLMRPIQGVPSLALFVVFSQSTTSIGLARAQVAKIASTKAFSSPS